MSNDVIMPRPEIKIDLNRYGYDGEVVMSRPSFRKLRDLRNAITSKAKYVKEDGEVTLQNIPQGDVEILGVLVYVQSGPFRFDVESFLKFCDKIDAVQIGNANRLFDEMNSAAEELDKEAASPLDS